jgi:hypothetical protein
MPRTAIDYSNCLIYKLCCNDPSIRDIYVGNTTNKTKRKQLHKSSCNNSNNKIYNSYVYQFIRENGGWDNWRMIILEEYQCENKNQAELRERYYIELLQSTLNTILRPAMSRQEKLEYQKEYKEEYYEAHKDQIKEKSREYYEANIENLKEYYEKNKEKILTKQKQYQEEHRESISERKREYYKKKKTQLITQETQEL